MGGHKKRVFVSLGLHTIIRLREVVENPNKPVLDARQGPARTRRMFLIDGNKYSDPLPASQLLDTSGYDMVRAI
jgi:hypothetical protein